MKNKFLDPSVEVLKFNCADATEGSPDTTSDVINGSNSEADGDDLFGETILG